MPGKMAVAEMSVVVGPTNGRAGLQSGDSPRQPGVVPLQSARPVSLTSQTGTFRANSVQLLSQGRHTLALTEKTARVK